MRNTIEQRGFTIIELIVVITLLGILAVFAVPRYASLEVEARSAEITALGGSLRSSAALAHAVWLAQGQPDTVTLEGRVIDMDNGYPSESAIDETLESIDGFLYDDSASPGVFSKTDNSFSPIPSCTVTYGAAPARGAAPAIHVDTSGC